MAPPPPISIVTLLLGPTLWTLAAAVHREQRRPMADDHMLATIGRISLSVFIVHAPLFRELSRPVGIWNALDPTTTLAVVVAFTVLCLWVSQQWARVDYRWGAEWWLRKLADRRRHKS